MNLKPLECANIIIECLGHMLFKTAVRDIFNNTFYQSLSFDFILLARPR